MTVKKLLHKSKSPLTSVLGYAAMLELSLKKRAKNSNSANKYKKELEWLENLKTGIKALNDIIFDAHSRIK